MKLTENQLIAIFPHAVDHAVYAQTIQQGWDMFNFTTKAARAAFCGIIGNETALRPLRENLNYSYELAMQYFPKARMNPDDCRDRTSRGGTVFGGWIYADLYGNGNEASGDGFRFRGGGLNQITFRSAYRDAGIGIGIDLEAMPERIVEAMPASLTASWFMAKYKPSILRLFNTGEVSDFLAGGALVGWTDERHTKIRLDYRQKAMDILDGDPPIATVTHRILHIGVATGDDVFKLQRLLVARSLYAGDIDGDFGPATREAVKKFQRNVFTANDDIDGVVGEKTWNALDKVT